MQCSQEELTILAVSYCDATVHSKCSHGKGVITFTVFTTLRPSGFFARVSARVGSFPTQVRTTFQLKGGQLHYSSVDSCPTRVLAAYLLKYGPLTSRLFYSYVHSCFTCGGVRLSYSGGASGPFTWAAAINRFGICILNGST